MSWRFAYSQYDGRLLLRLFAALVCGFSVPVDAAQPTETPSVTAPIQLRCKFQAKQRFDCVVAVETLMTMNIGPMQLTSSGSQRCELIQVTRKVDKSGAAIVSQVLQRMQMNMESPTGEGYRYDSADRRSKGPLDVLIGVEVTSSVNPLGEIVGSDGPRKLTLAMRRSPMMSGLFQQMLSGDGLQPLLGHTDLVLPEDPVNVGTTWKVKRQVNDPIFGQQTIDLTYEYRGQELLAGREVEKIEFFVTRTQMAAPGPDALGKVTDQDYRGEILFDNEAGRLVESTAKRKTGMDTVIAGQAVRQEVETVIKMSVSPLDETSPSPNKRRRRRRKP